MFCHCRNGNGHIKQKPRTIEDHRRQYPRLPSPPRIVQPSSSLGSSPRPLGSRIFDDITNSPSIRHPSPNPLTPPACPHTPIQQDCIDNPLSSPEHGNNPVDQDSPVHSPRPVRRAVRWHRDPHVGDEGNADDEELPDYPPAIDHEFHDPLIPMNTHWLEVDLAETHFDNLGDEGQQIEDDAFLDENFGLPDSADNRVPEQEQLFQLPMDEEPTADPEDDPNEEIDLGECCAAF
jgi:hypothetical protein